MIVLGIDPGYDRAGLAVIKKDKGQPKLLHYECLLAPRGRPFTERLTIIGNQVEAAIKTWRPNVLALETVFLSKNQKTAMRVSEVRGMLLFIAARLGVNIQEYTPLEIKKSVFGHGQTSKEQITRLLPRLITFSGKLPKYDDEYDAIALALTVIVASRPATKS